MKMEVPRARLAATTISILSLLLISLSANATNIKWTGCGISKLGFMQDVAKAYEKKSGVRIELEGGGATKGIRQVALGESNLGGSCRMPLVHEAADGSLQIESSEHSVKMIPVGWDALVVITHGENKMVSAITRDQLKKVLTGKITSWDQLGAQSNKPINLYVRTGKISGVGLTLRQQLFNNTDQNFSKSATYLPSSGKIEEAVEKDPYGLAISGISSSRHRSVNMLKLEEVEPTMANLKSGKYMLYRILFLVTPPDYRERPELQDFVDFALSVEGQKVIKQAGTLPYRHGFALLSSGASTRYLQALDVIEKSGIYTASGY
ncbi:MAG: substrate-binding domain-containing protein [Chromatiales bacterium]|nr:substrate-binding domain-containing protein [Chromatiales bacterium]